MHDTAGLGIGSDQSYLRKFNDSTSKYNCVLVSKTHKSTTDHCSNMVLMHDPIIPTHLLHSFDFTDFQSSSFHADCVSIKLYKYLRYRSLLSLHNHIIPLKLILQGFLYYKFDLVSTCACVSRQLPLLQKNLWHNQKRSQS